MFLSKDVFVFLRNALFEYYKNDQLACSVTNQLIKLVLQKEYFLLEKNYIIDNSLLEVFSKYIYDITVLHMPYQYILKNVQFGAVSLYIESPILIPRIESEELTYWLIEKFKHYQNHYFNIVDFCSGSGCIGIALLHFFKNSTCTGFDICHKAVEVSSYNASMNDVKKRYKIYHRDILLLKKNKKYDIIISNPPYISFDEYNKLDYSVKLWESEVALTDKKYGYSFILHLLVISKKKLQDNGIIVIELCDSYADFILKKAKNIYPKELVFLWIDQYNKKRAIIVVKGMFRKLYNERCCLI